MGLDGHIYRDCGPLIVLDAATPTDSKAVDCGMALPRGPSRVRTTTMCGTRMIKPKLSLSETLIKSTT